MIRRKLSEFKRHLSQSHKLPVNAVSSDVYLVSFPKSGNTWLRFLLANLLRQAYSASLEVNWFTIQGIIPDVQVSRQIAPGGPFGLNFPRLIKSHHDYCPLYHRTIFLLRDPQDALFSFWQHLRNFSAIDDGMDFESMVRDPDFGIERWVAFHQGWLYNHVEGNLNKIIRFEDLRANPGQCLREIADLLGIPVDDSIIESTLQSSSRDVMARSELKHRSKRITQAQERSFVGEGASAGHHYQISETTKELIRSKSVHLLRDWGYLDTSEEATA